VSCSSREFLFVTLLYLGEERNGFIIKKGKPPIDFDQK
jgi:hypothetical protein